MCLLFFGAFFGPLLGGQARGIQILPPNLEFDHSIGFESLTIEEAAEEGARESNVRPSQIGDEQPMSGNDKKDEAASSAAPPPAPPAVEAIEEDDEFEEFEPCQWSGQDEDAEDSQQWQVSDDDPPGRARGGWWETAEAAGPRAAFGSPCRVRGGPRGNEERKRPGPAPPCPRETLRPGPPAPPPPHGAGAGPPTPTTAVRRA